jgi:hypothetical protein
VEEECGSRSLRLARAHVLEDHLASLLCSGALLRLILKLLPLVCLEQLHFGLINFLPICPAKNEGAVPECYGVLFDLDTDGSGIGWLLKRV